MVRASVDEVMVEVMAARPAPVGTDAGVRVLATMQELVRRVEREESREVRGVARRTEREGWQREEARDRRNRDELLPCRREVVALHVMANVLDAERRPLEAAVVSHPPM